MKKTIVVNDIEKQFVPYESAKALKKLGFNEECFGMYNTRKKLRIGKIGGHPDPAVKDPQVFVKNRYHKGSGCAGIAAPLWQQGFDWFREKKEGYHYDILQFFGGMWGYSIYGGERFDPIYEHAKFETYEKARFSCLEKLIEIINGN